MSDVRYEIRLARVDEIALLGEIEDAAAELFGGTTLADSIPDGTASPEDLAAAQRGGMLWVAVAPDGAPVGFAYTRWLGDEPHLEELDVHPDHGRRGVGAQLVRAFLSWARSRGATGVTLSTFRDIPWNEPFYARLGFRALAAAELTAPMLELIATETRKGLPADRRVVMRLALVEDRPLSPRVTLRAAERDDLAFLSTLLRAAIGPSFVETIDLATHQVIEMDGRAAGCLSVEDFIDRVALNRIFLLPEAQRRGVGTELIRSLLGRAHAQGLPVVLTVQRVNHAARSLYERLGFAVVSETSTHVGMEAAPPEPVR